MSADDDTLWARVVDLEEQLGLHRQIRVETTGQVAALKEQVALLQEIKAQLETGASLADQTIAALQATIDTQASVVDTQKLLVANQSDIIDHQRARITQLEEALAPFMARQKQEAPS